MSKENEKAEETDEAVENFDMSRCQPRDKIISCQGMIFTYISPGGSNPDCPHIVMYPNGAYGERTDDGKVSCVKPLPTDHNIVGFAPEESEGSEEKIVDS